MDAKQIGEVIKEARKRKGKTQTALSAVLGIMPLDVLHYETGEIKHIPFEKRAKMSSVLNIPTCHPRADCQQEKNTQTADLALARQKDCGGE